MPPSTKTAARRRRTATRKARSAAKTAASKATRPALITPRAFKLLKELARNNERDWFEANKQRYFDEVRDPLLAFIEAFAPKLRKISPELVADSRPNGGSLFRIYRDTRFSKDKSPYKTYAAMRFLHVRGRELTAPGFYLHLEPGRIFSAAGIWHPPSDALTRMRDAIVADPAGWKRATRGGGRALDEGSDRLKRPPRGVDPDHPLVEDLKRKGFTMSASFSERDACAADFVDVFAAECRRTVPLMRFLARSLEVDW